jgi:isocitrate dehydrogenase kinase/phosphatase
VTAPAARLDLAPDGARTIHDAFEAYRDAFQRITRGARARFERRDWRGAQQDTVERLELRDRHVREIVARVRELLGDAASGRALWARMKAAYSGLIAGRRDWELAETFFNSACRRVFDTVGVDPRIEFVASDFAAPPPSPGERVYDVHPFLRDTAALVSAILRDVSFSVPWRDLAGDARLAAAEIEAHLAGQESPVPVDSIEVLRPVFYRNKGAYLVGRLRRGDLVSPLILALLNGEGGVEVDAVLLAPADASNVFSFTRSYFRMDADAPHEVVAFLKSILPQKRLSELYIAIGYNKHGKTELYREILAHLEQTRDRFEPARGDRGLVMAVFTLPSLDIVFKVIRDSFPFPKATSRQEVKSKYQLVFRHDRAGRLVDAQEFEHLAFDRSRFAPGLLSELLSECGETVRVTETQVHFAHLYAERRLAPLNLYLRETDEGSARHAVLEYGQAIRDLAATNTFPGDLLLKNFGMTRTGRVIFYDYDELCFLTDCNFRDMPRASSDDEEMAGEPWFFVGEDDVFPEEFLPFLAFTPPQREAFLSAHRELLTPAFWRGMQESLRAGEIVDVFPYRQGQRLRNRGL